MDTEAWFFKAPKQELKFDAVLTPMGPSGLVKNFELAENPNVPKKVDYLVYDTDALAKDAVLELYKGDIPAEHITRLFSIGLLGKERKSCQHAGQLQPWMIWQERNLQTA